MQNFISIFEVILMTVFVLLAVAFLTVAERKTMASMQRRVGPNIVGTYGLLQAFADALKLILKEYLVPTQANKKLFTIGPAITLIFALLSYSVIPFSVDLSIGDLEIAILIVLSFSGLSGYGVLLAGWSANSKYSFLGSLRSTAQLVSYELILSTAVLIAVLMCSTLSLVIVIESQRSVFACLPLLPVFIMFLMSAVAETNRAPFDLAEAESELVSGHMTEHSGVLFVFFFLAEYASIILICLFTSALFLGAYLGFTMESEVFNDDVVQVLMHIFITSFTDNIFDTIIMAIKLNLLLFFFVLLRASEPRMRFDALMNVNWLALLPLIIAFTLLVPIAMLHSDLLPSLADFLTQAEFGEIVMHQAHSLADKLVRQKEGIVQGIQTFRHTNHALCQLNLRHLPLVKTEIAIVQDIIIGISNTKAQMGLSTENDCLFYYGKLTSK